MLEIKHGDYQYFLKDILEDFNSNSSSSLYKKYIIWILNKRSGQNVYTKQNKANHTIDFRNDNQNHNYDFHDYRRLCETVIGWFIQDLRSN